MKPWMRRRLRYHDVVNSWSLGAALGLALLSLGGCTAAPTSSGMESASRVRCLNRPAPGAPSDGTRPLIFLFCIQSP